MGCGLFVFVSSGFVVCAVWFDKPNCTENFLPIEQLHRFVSPNKKKKENKIKIKRNKKPTVMILCVFFW